MIRIGAVPEQRANLRELRIALVCYGGVSLAIYMHGITKELHSLVLASRAFEADQENHRFERASTEKVYWNVLKDMFEASGVITRVVIDIISGTSAGGINGVFLGKALAKDLKQDNLRRLWLEEGDLDVLLLGANLPGDTSVELKLRIGWQILEALKNDQNSILDGSLMNRLLLKAMSEMPADPGVDPTNPLLPDTHLLELFVTLTDMYGYQRLTVVQNRLIWDKRHRHVMVFSRQKVSGVDEFAPRVDPALAFAARATSSFPGAFPPVSLDEFAQSTGSGLDQSQQDRFFPQYRATGTKPGYSYFIDGGVLDNFPFGHAIEAVQRRPSASEVDRRLLYIQPHPKDVVDQPGPVAQPGWLQTIWAGFSGVRADEPILDDLLRLRFFNQQVRQVKELIDSNRPLVAAELAHAREKAKGAKVDPLDPVTTLEQLEPLYKEIYARLEGFAGENQQAYVQSKVMTVLESWTNLISSVCAFTEDSEQAALLNGAFWMWAKNAGLVGRFDVADPTQTDAQELFLKQFDRPHTLRRLDFIIQTLNEMYDDLEGRDRESLDRAKAALYGFKVELMSALAGTDISPGLAGAIRQFDGPKLFDFLKEHPINPVEAFYVEHQPDLSWFQEQLEVFYRTRFGDLASRLYTQFKSVTASWPEDDRRRLLVSYMGFPFWDVIIFPMTFLSIHGELSEVPVMRISPDEQVLLFQGGAEEKLKGISLHHFGAFLERSYRENDLLWGHLDGVEAITSMLLGDTEPADRKSGRYREGFQAVIDREERGIADHVPGAMEEKETMELIAKVSKRISALPLG